MRPSLALATFVFVVAAITVRADDLFVTRPDDPAPDGCEVFPIPDCSLREAVIAANDRSGPDTIILQAGTYTLSRPGSGEDFSRTGDLDVRDNLTIAGASRQSTSISVSASVADRALHLIGAASATVEDVTITGGRPPGDGGCILAESGTMILSDVRVTDCSPSGSSSGGALSTGGPLVVRGSVFDFNTAYESGAIRTSGEVEVTNSSFIGNSATDCGALDLGNNTMSIEKSNFAQNAAEAFGGAICASGQLSIRESTFERNECTDGSCRGGGILNFGLLHVDGCTFHENGAAGRGGALFSYGKITVENSTFDDDQGSGGGSVLSLANNAIARLDHITAASDGFALDGENASDRIQVRNSLFVAGCVNATATITSLGGNIEAPSDTCGFDHPTDQSGVSLLDVGLAPAAANGGPTQTMALDPGSVAVGSAVDPCARTDQRGIPRPLRGPSCDSGSFEVLPDDAIVVTRLTDPGVDPCPSPSDCSLRGAMIQASATPDDHDTILLGRGTYLLSVPGPDEDAGLTGDLDAIGAMTIIGVDRKETVIDGNGLDRVLHGHPGGSSNLTLSKLGITGGNSTSEGGGVSAISATLDRVEIFFNEAQGEGGGIAASGDLSISKSHIHDNLAAMGGGVSSTQSTLIADSTLNGNEATQDGGGIFHPPHSTFLQVFNSTLAYNDAVGQGGAINTHGPADLRHVTFALNHADGVGDDVYASNAGAIQLLNTILSEGCFAAPGATFESLGGNVESPLDTCGLTDPTDQVSVPDEDLAFDDLGDYGGPTPTFSLLWRSVARDAAVTVVPVEGDPGIGCFPTDQRGFSRPAGIACDSGAYEHHGDLFSDGFDVGDTSEWSIASP